ncbi:hypothetical protein PsYK624_125480 [Phanerochaete sordida]|uniref:Uncharacterized protein n=1 Tax=Phanerochaete sordida TaxID=48140 RepID=A0A9P3GK10_9APHY|nr:hypothetical protein PsYK624_125480 [Phanerochaete sordida]
MLNLRRLSPGSSTGYSESHPTALSSVDFRAPSGLFGDLGEPLEHGQSLDVDEGGGGDASTGAAEDDLEYSLQDAEAGRNGVASPVEADDAA